MAQSPETRDPQPATHDARSPARRQVLVVEDEAPLRLLFREILREQRVEIAEAGTGQEAIAQLQQTAFDLVFLDCRLPDMDGLDLLRRARSLQLNPAQKIVVMTGHGDARLAMEAIHLGAVEYLTKPFEMKRVCKILQLHLLGGLLSIGDDLLALPDDVLERVEALPASRVLVVDAQSSLRELMGELLGQLGCEVHAAADARAAQGIMQQAMCELVVTAVGRTGEPEAGLDLVRWVKEMYPLTEVVAILGAASIESIGTVLHAGASEVIPRPVPSLNHIIDVLERVLRRRALVLHGERASEELQRKNFELGLLYKISNAMSYTTDHHTLIDMIMRSLCEVIPFDIAAALLIDPERTIDVYLNGEVAEADIESAARQLMVAYGTLAGQASSSEAFRRNLVRLPLAPDGTWGTAAAEAVGRVEPTFFNVPIAVGRRVIGMLNVSSVRGREFNEGEVRLLSTLANQMAGAIERVQQIIASEKHKMEAMVRSMSEGVVMIDIRGDIVVCNPQAKRLLGFASVAVLTEGELRAALAALGVDPPEPEQHHAVQEVASTRGDLTRYLRVEQILVRDEGADARIGQAIILTDISKERELTHLKDDFISTVSHELRTPLAAMKEAVELLADGTAGPTNEHQSKFLGIATSNMGRLGTLINDLLDISKIEAGKMSLSLTAVDLQSLIQELAQSYQGIAGRRRFAVRCESLPPVFADKARVLQVLTNLIGNAIKYTPEDGTITVGARTANGAVECAITDTGPGIPEDRLPQLFHKFQQVGTTVQKTGMHGTGLGLALCKQLVELHHGWIKAESTVGEGSTFTFALPVYVKETALATYLTELRGQAQHDAESCGMVVLRLVGGQTWTPELHAALKHAMHRGDLTCVYAPDTLLVLAGADAAGLRALQQRLLAVTHEALAASGPAGAATRVIGGNVLDSGEISAEALAQQAIAAVRDEQAPRTAPSPMAQPGGGTP